ncbi:MAG: aspartate/glutamate racemase family protein [Acidimicrobiales bacterium]
MRLAVVTGIGCFTAQDAARRRSQLQAAARAGTEVEVFSADSGIPYVESTYELHRTEVAVAEKVVEVADAGFDAVMGSAFLDNGLDAARELVDIPVVGPAKTTLYLAATLANRFAIIMAAGDLGKHAWARAKLAGVVDRVVAIPTLDVTVAEFFREPDRAADALEAVGRASIDEHGAEAFVLGCGATTGLAASVTERLGVPVLDPGLVALKHAEMLVDLGLSQSKLAYPNNERVGKLIRS